jgi:hypothetical protein
LPWLNLLMSAGASGRAERIRYRENVRGTCASRNLSAAGWGSAAAMTRSAPSAERSGLPEMETIRSEPPGHGAHYAFACFQRDLLREHNVSDRQSADRHETQPLLQATTFVDLAHVHRGPDVDPVPLSAVASDNLEVALPGELLPLRRRQPLSQQPQRPALRRALSAVPNEKGSRRSHAGAATQRRRSKAEHGRKATTRRPAWGRRGFLPQWGRTIGSATPDLDRSGPRR